MTNEWEWASVRTIYRYFWTLHHHFNLTQWTQSTLGLLWSSYHTWNILHWPKRTGKRDNWKKKNRFDNKVKVMTMWGKKKKCWGTFYSFAAVPRPLCYNSRNHPLKDKKNPLKQSWWCCLQVFSHRLFWVLIVFGGVALAVFLSTSAYLDWQVHF